MSTIINFLNNDFKAFNINESVQNVKDFFKNVAFSHFPVLEEGIYIGSIAKEDVFYSDNKGTLNEFRYNFERFFVRSSMIWLDVFEVFARNNANIIPVLNENNNYIGYYELDDMLSLLYETPFIKEDGAIVIVEIDNLKFSMSQLSQIVESNNGKILGMYITENTSEKVKVTIKMSLGNITAIIQTLRRYDYDIISEHQEDTYLQNLKDRSDYLDKYLNM